jgi:aspartokinase/homoserine dehydrogenase 1
MKVGGAPVGSHETLRALPDVVPRRAKSVSLIIAGATGRVGSALCRQVVAGRESREAEGVEVKVIAIANRSRTLVRRAIDVGEVASLIDEGDTTDWPKTLERLGGQRSSPTLFVDCTASAEVAALYGPLIERGIGIVTPNKIALSGSLVSRNALIEAARQQGLPLLYETTVGAALPLLRTIRDLVASGDRVLSISAVLSGTLSYILGRLHGGVPFSAAVCEAVDKGLTEPDPTIDLGGLDVARKLVILVRESGIAIEADGVASEPLAGSSARFYGDLGAFRTALEPFDKEWRLRAQGAEARGSRLVYAATYDRSQIRAATREIELDSPLARTRPGENVVVIRTTRYDHVPLTIAGPGAGPEVTAAGVLAEILSVVNAL